MGQITQGVSILNPGDFWRLRNAVCLAAERMSKSQLLELADGLYDELRSRRGEAALLDGTYDLQMIA